MAEKTDVAAREIFNNTYSYDVESDEGRKYIIEFFEDARIMCDIAIDNAKELRELLKTILYEVDNSSLLSPTIAPTGESITYNGREIPLCNIRMMSDYEEQLYCLKRRINAMPGEVPKEEYVSVEIKNLIKWLSEHEPEKPSDVGTPSEGVAL